MLCSARRRVQRVPPGRPAVRSPVEHLIPDDAEGVNVVARVGRPRRASAAARRTAACARRAGAVARKLPRPWSPRRPRERRPRRDAADAEVGDAQARACRRPSCCDEDVGRLQVAVDDGRRRGGGRRRRSRPGRSTPARGASGRAGRGRPRRVPLADEAGEVAAGDVLVLQARRVGARGRCARRATMPGCRPWRMTLVEDGRLVAQDRRGRPGRGRTSAPPAARRRSAGCAPSTPRRSRRRRAVRPAPSRRRRQGRSPGWKRGRRAGRSGSRSSARCRARSAATVVPAGSAGRRSDWRTAAGTCVR